tara:strand:- start:1852 stop:2058 length:207 start_codon:yes stop_codon:yes gene_type:complete
MEEIMKPGDQLPEIKNMKQEDMFYNLDQIQHILNGLIAGKVYDGKKLDQEKLIKYKLSVVKIVDQVLK